MNHIRASVASLAALVAVLAWVVPADAHRTASQATIVTVTAGKPSTFAFTLSTKTVKTGSVTFKVTNKATIPHTFKVCSSSTGGSANACAGKGTATIQPGKSATLTITFTKKGTYEYLCTFPGHASFGMKGDLKVT